MFGRITACGLAALACGAAGFAQKVEGPTFEVASIKPAAPMQPGIMRMGRGGGPGTQDPGQMTFSNLSLRDLLAGAFNVKRYQISGPDWMDNTRFDIIAKVPAGATKDETNVMMQNLLKERFGLTLHHETKPMPMYALVVAKGGPKLKETDESANTQPPAPNPAGPDGAPPPPPLLTIGKDGMPQMPAGFRPPGGGMMMMMMMPGRMRMMGNGVTIANLIDNLGRLIDRPIVDQTSLTSKYDITLDFEPDPALMRGMPAPPPGGMMGPPPGAGGGEGAVRTPEGGEAAALPVALQEQLGLKLEAKKGPVDLLVVDHLEKSPTEN